TEAVAPEEATPEPTAAEPIAAASPLPQPAAAEPAPVEFPSPAWPPMPLSARRSRRPQLVGGAIAAVVLVGVLTASGIALAGRGGASRKAAAIVAATSVATTVPSPGA